jgi:hypothetical protein
MPANGEPSNQSFEVDREATVCFANRRFFLPDVTSQNDLNLQSAVPP